MKKIYLGLYNGLGDGIAYVFRFCPALTGFLCVIAVLAVTCAGGFATADDQRYWLLIDTMKMSLSVMQGDVPKRSYENISIGRGGVTGRKQRHDGKTPLGEFHIVRMTTDTPFHRFFALDYPNLQHAEGARRAGNITQSEFAAIRQAIRDRRIPPQNTALGGYIGIHGIGAGNAAVHADFNWTNGCIALTNAQIDDLSRWVRVGTRVLIRR